jgi:hypothetical protein
MNKDHNIKLHIVGKIDCLRLASTKFIIDDAMKNNNLKIETSYELYFETQFDIFVQKLLRDNIDANVAKSPVIYTIVNHFNSGEESKGLDWHI